MKGILESLARIQEKAPLIMLLVALTATLFFGYYAQRIQTDANFDQLFRDDSDTIVYKDMVANDFGSTDKLFVLVMIDEETDDTTAPSDIRDPAIIHAVESLGNSIESEPSVSSTTSIADVLYSVYGRLPDTLEESKQMIANLPIDTSSFVSEDYTALNMVIDVNIGRKPGTIESIEDSLNEKLSDASRPHGVKMILTGRPTLINRIMNLLINDNIKTVGIALIGVLFILWFYFRSFSIALVATTPVVITLLLLAGTLTLMNIRISFMIASVGAMMVGMGIDYSIHMTHAFHENVKKAAKDPLKATVVSVGGALFASAATTAAGFIAMMLGVTPNSITQGKVLAMGIGFAFLTSMLILPPMLIIQRRFIYSRIDEIVFRLKDEEIKTTLNKRVLGLLGEFQAKHPVMILIAFIVTTALLVPGIGKVYLDTDNENWIPPHDPVEKALDLVRTKFSGLDSQTYLLMLNENYAPMKGEEAINDLRDPEVMRALSRWSSAVEEYDGIDSVSSPIEEITRYNDGKVPQDKTRIDDIINQNPSARAYFNTDYSAAKMTVNGDIDSDLFKEKTYDYILAEIETSDFPEEVRVIPQGGVAQDRELDASLGKDTMMTTGIGFIFVIIIASLFYGSAIVGFLALVPVLFASVWTVSIMGWIGLPFTVLTTGMLAILMGIGIDFSIHIIHKTRELLNEGKDITRSLIGALEGTGEAITISTVTTVFGFLALSLASLLATRRLGWTLAIGIASTYICCMLFVPAILAIEHRIKRRSSR